MTDKQKESLNIYQRLNEIKKAVPYIKKDANVEGYKAVTHDQVTAQTRDAFIKHGVAIVPDEIEARMVETGATTGKGSPWMRFEGKYNIAFVNIDDKGDLITLTLTAHALDYGDKAPGKALSYAVKSAVLKILQIETGVNDESREQDVRSRAETIQAVSEECKGSIQAISNGIATDNLEKAVEAWHELTNAEKSALWVAPTECRKLGVEPPFTTNERNIMKSDEWARVRNEMFRIDDGENNG